MPATKPPSSRSSPSSEASATRPNTSTTARRTASWLEVSNVRSTSGQPCHAERTASTPVNTARATNSEQDQRLVQRMAAGEDEGEQEDRAELADAARSKQVGAEARTQLPASRRIGISIPIAVVAIAEPV